MKFEFILLALVGAHAPMEIQRYEAIGQCQATAAELTKFVNLNYTTVRSDSRAGMESLLARLVAYNETWEVVPIPIPSMQELLDNNEMALRSLQMSVTSAINTGQGYGAAAQVNDARNIRIVVSVLLENAKKPKAPLDAPPAFLIEPSEIKYACLAAPGRN